jgi:hypothetical protein
MPKSPKNRYWFTPINEDLRRRFELLGRHLDERAKRLWASVEAIVLGRGGSSIVQAATGLSKPVITAGMRELEGEVPLAEGRIRREDAGPKRTEDTDPTLLGYPVQDFRDILRSLTSLTRMECRPKAEGSQVAVHHPHLGTLPPQGVRAHGSRPLVDGWRGVRRSFSKTFRLG